MIDLDKLRKIYRVTKGKRRILYTYKSDNDALSKLHGVYVDFIARHTWPSKFAHAYTKDRSIYTNALWHVDNDIFVKIDVKNFFPSINHNLLAKAMFYELNRARSNTVTLFECREMIRQSTVASKGLPLGLRPSPALSNLYMKSFDIRVVSKLEKLGLESPRYTRYADDIFVSFQKTDEESMKSAVETIKTICAAELKRLHLEVNHKKTRVIDLAKSNHVKLAGLTIAANGHRITVNRHTVRDVYFEAIRLYPLKDVAKTDSDIELQIAQLKGKHSFLFSVQKMGYSDAVLSIPMKERVRSLGYESLEELIKNL